MSPLKVSALLLTALVVLPEATPAASTGRYQSVVIYFETNNAGPVRRDVNQFRTALGHFKTTVTNRPVDDYPSGEMQGYDVVCYLGAGHRGAAPLPPAFLADVAAHTNRVVWFSHNIGQLLSDTGVAARLGLTYQGLSNGYDVVLYKDVNLIKHSSDTELAVLRVTDPAVARATAFSLADPNIDPAPYAVESSNLFYFADNPFRLNSTPNRSLVLYDVLHDILRTSTPTNHRALVRIEDIRPGYSSTTRLAQVSASLEARGIRAALAVVPRYVDPQLQYTNLSPPDLRMSEYRPFLQALQDWTRRGHLIVQHGYTHQNDEENEVSGVGYEFWHSGEWRPLTTDTWAWASDRVAAGLAELSGSGFPPVAWETPHYTCSLLDAHAIGARFPVQYERVQTFDIFSEGLSRSQIEVASSRNPEAGSPCLPFVVHRGIYGSRFLPENLGYYSPGTYDENGLEMNISNMVEYAAQLKVVRDAVASFYFHVQWGSATASILTNIVHQVEAQGYTFTDIDALCRDEPAE
jgi:uncharacterized protein YdaL